MNILADASLRKVKEYFCNYLEPIEASKTLFALTNLGSNERLHESRVKSAALIAEYFDGIILSDYAKELANKLMLEYLSYYPGSLMTRKDTKKYTDVNYIKLLNAVGVYGFDYVLKVIRIGKAKINDPGSNIDENRMLQALRWNEKRENVDVQSSNIFHHVKGLELLGFDETATMLEKCSYIIANIYEQTIACDKIETLDDKVFDIRSMKLHFLQKADMLEAFYNMTEPVIPEGYSKSDFEGATIVYNLASKGMLKDSEQVLNYYANRSKWEDANNQLAKEFSKEELNIIFENSEQVRSLISATW